MLELQYNYYTNTDTKTCANRLLKTIDLECILKGEEGIYKWIFDCFFRDPNDPYNLSIECVSQNPDIFKWKYMDKENNRQEVYDSGLMKFLSFYETFDRIIPHRLECYTLEELNCQGYSEYETELLFSTLTKRLVRRRGLSKYVIEEIRFLKDFIEHQNHKEEDLINNKIDTSDNKILKESKPINPCDKEKLKYSDDASGYIYLLQEREFFRLNEPTYKIGATTQTLTTRLGSYPKGSVIIIAFYVKNCFKLEKILKMMFESKFHKCIEYGQEYFRGNVDVMMYTISDMITKSYHNCATAQDDIHIKDAYKTYHTNKIKSEEEKHKT